jgi:type IV secretory pathway VirB10-like protein
MAEKKPEFTVTDRRLFTSEGELRPDAAEEQPATKSAAEPKPPEPPKPAEGAPQTPPPPSAAEQKAQAEAYSQSTRDLDARLKRELGSSHAQDLQITFERFLASLYMTALLQLGLVQEQGGRPQIDLIGARQTIDTIDILKDKTKGNLTSAEEAFLQNVLYELHMAYIEVTNALARGAQAPGQPGPKQQ